MQCPEVINFKAPKSVFKVVHQSANSEFDAFDFCHSVSIVVPNASQIPESLEKIFIENCDCVYYKVVNVPLILLLKKSFIDNYVDQGTLHVLSVDNVLECDNCIAITSSKQLHLSLNRETYQSLNLPLDDNFIEQKVKRSTKDIVPIKKYTLNLNSFYKHKNYDTLMESFLKLEPFNLLIKWRPPESKNVCPSSIARYFSYYQMKIKSCQLDISKKVHSDVKVPYPPATEEFMNDEDLASQIYEWIGALTLECDINNSDSSGYLSSYIIPKPNLICPNVLHLQCNGFVTSDILALIKLEVGKLEPNPWACVYFSQFMDHPLPNRSKYNMYNDCLILFQEKDEYIFFNI